MLVVLNPKFSHKSVLKECCYPPTLTHPHLKTAKHPDAPLACLTTR